MSFLFEQIINSEDETVELASKFSAKLEPGDVIILNGNLGAGKTFFIRQTLKNLGIDSVSSPTFTLVNEYTGKYKIYHFDFYRINNSEELFDIGFNDYLNDDESVIFIEWGNLIPGVLPHRRQEISIQIESDFSRKFVFEKYD
ncbi:MAG: tRNA (adenosine(37)-N6)-threonylcarbamoyltransferase complex ATPase subunit type 1 TsaE [Ignavibacteriaceae bacterium]